MRAITHCLTAGVLTAALLTGSDWPGPTVDDAERAAYSAACRTYDNRARFLSRQGPVDFVVLMAEGCVAAQHTLAEGRPADRRAARLYLARLLEFRDTIARINTERLYGKDATAFSRPKTEEGQMRPLGGVSKAGEFLIAHRMGLLAAFETWRARSDGFDLALES